MSETELMHDIMLDLSKLGHLVFRANVGTVKTQDGRYISMGLPKGFSDLFGIQAGTGRMFFVEVKFGDNKPTPEQAAFLERVRAMGALGGVAYSVEDAEKILTTDSMEMFGYDVSDPLKAKKLPDTHHWTALQIWAVNQSQELYGSLYVLRAHGARLKRDDRWGCIIAHDGVPDDIYEKAKGNLYKHRKGLANVLCYLATGGRKS